MSLVVPDRRSRRGGGVAFETNAPVAGLFSFSPFSFLFFRLVTAKGGGSTGFSAFLAFLVITTVLYARIRVLYAHTMRAVCTCVCVSPDPCTHAAGAFGKSPKPYDSAESGEKYSWTQGERRREEKLGIERSRASVATTLGCVIHI